MNMDVEMSFHHGVQDDQLHHSRHPSPPRNHPDSPARKHLRRIILQPIHAIRHYKSRRSHGYQNASELEMAVWCAAFSLCSVIWLVLVVCCLPHREPENASWWRTYTGTWILFILVPEALNVIFYFSDAIALAVGLGAHSCANAAYTLQNGITNNARDTGRRCCQAQAVAAFMFFALVAWILSALLSVEAIMPWEEWPPIAWLVPWRAAVRDTTDPRNPDPHAVEPPVAAFPEPRRGGGPTGAGSWQDGDLEQAPYTANLGSGRSRPSPKEARRGGGPAVPADDGFMEPDAEDRRREFRSGGPEVTEHYRGLR